MLWVRGWCRIYTWGCLVQVNFADMAAQMSRMSQLAIDVENLKMRNALLESELLRTRQVQTRLHPSAHCPTL